MTICSRCRKSMRTAEEWESKDRHIVCEKCCYILDYTTQGDKLKKENERYEYLSQRTANVKGSNSDITLKIQTPKR
jgi:predicted amidophosphoribosyltransferase